MKSDKLTKVDTGFNPETIELEKKKLANEKFKSKLGLDTKKEILKHKPNEES